MERLTIKNSDGTYSQPTHTTFEKMFYKLAQFEDFMEEQGIDNLEDLKRFFKDYRYASSLHIHLSARKSNKRMFYVFQLMQLLKYENMWQKLKEFVTENFNYFKNSYGIFDDIFADDYRKVLDKMQELEDGKDTNVSTK